MTDRRRALRYVLYASVAAELAPLQDVIIEHLDDARLVAICGTAARPSETLGVQFAGASGEIVTIDADVVASKPVVRSDRLSFRVELRAQAAVTGEDSARRARLANGITPDAPMHAVLTRRYAVHIRNISGVGCLLSGHVPFERGTIALLEARIEDRRCIEVARITRDGGAGISGEYLMGSEFLPLAPTGVTSVRALIATLEARRGHR